MPYRVEIAKQGRAGCKSTECTKAKEKIAKGELRMGTLVTIQDHTSWTWKHWGCVTPAQIANLQEESGGDTDMVDGYDELPSEAQERVGYALLHGHVHDEDWKGDVECNRVGAKGYRVKEKKAPKKKGKKGADDDADEAEEPKPQKKRGRAVKEEEEEAPAPKKSRGRGKKAAPKEEDSAESEVEQPKPKKAARGKKATVKEEDAAEGEVEQPKPKKAARGKKTPVYTEEDDEDEEDVEEAPKPKRGRKKAPAKANDDKPAPKRAGRKKKAAAGDD
ncbi:zf-PARP-domain-containing protein [Byssothecium circinans]|uniref:Zf-PARP-domain-containing protein n=1 Tax=Byssothecium circinans TaxID=147558 RepID=A0A6A5U6C9_9PLEO|nr:zf-PARP-domain-containing protein [Byssothecium circinans]